MWFYVGALTLAAVAAPTAPQGLPLDRIVAVVDTQTVTQRELAAEARLAMVRRAKDPAQASALPLDAGFVHSFLNHLIGQMLVAREARRVGVDEVPERDVDAAYNALVRRFATEADFEAFLQALGMPPTFVREVLRRDQQNERYLQQRLRTRLAGLGVSQDPNDPGLPARRAAALRAFLPAYLTELRQAVEVRRLNAAGVLEREQAP